MGNWRICSAITTDPLVSDEHHTVHVFPDETRGLLQSGPLAELVERLAHMFGHLRRHCPDMSTPTLEGAEKKRGND